MSMVSPSHIMQAWARTFSSSRTFPGQEYRANRSLSARGDAADRFAVLGGHAFDKVAFEQRQILLALGQIAAV